MEPVWEFFENMNELVYVADVDTYEFIYMNRRALTICGFTSLEQTRGKKCYEVLQNASAPVRSAITESFARVSLRSGVITTLSTIGICW